MNFSWLVQFVELRSHCATDESILLPEGKIAHFLQQQSASASPEPAILYRKLPLDVSGVGAKVGSSDGRWHADIATGALQR